jgi:hypothetical protein
VADRDPAGYEARLNRFWNGLVRPPGDPAAGGDHGLDPATAETVRRLHELGAAPPPASSRERVRRAVRADVRSHARSSKEPPVDRTASRSADVVGAARPPAGANGRIALPTPGRSPGTAPPATVPPRWGGGLLAAALLLATLGLGFFALDPGRQRAEGPVGLPALVAPATPAPEAAGAETLAVLDLPAATVPSGGSAYWAFAHATLPPGIDLAWDAAAGAGTPGVRFEHVVAGEYAVRPGGPARVLRAGGTGGWEAVAAGSEVALEAGDAVALAGETPYAAANRGAAPVAVVQAILTGLTTGASHPEGWEQHDVDQAFGPAVPDGPAVLRLRRVPVAPRATLPPLPGASGQVAVTLEAEASLAMQADGALRNIGDRPLTAYVLTLEPAGADAGAATPAP